MTLVYKQIIVAIDGSKESEWAFKKAVAIAGQNDAALNLVQHRRYTIVFLCGGL